MPRDLRIRGYTVGQFPNPPLWVATAAFAVAWIASTASTLEEVALAIGYVALSVWAYEEAVRGVNGFRRALGGVALVLIVVALARAIG
jgi:hypothetical protein